MFARFALCLPDYVGDCDVAPMSGRFANRKDVVHKPIVEGLEARGFVVYDMPDPGDILVYGWNARDKSYQWTPMELKSSNGVRKKKADGSDELSPRQKRIRDKKARAPIPIVHSIPEALILYGMEHFA